MYTLVSLISGLLFTLAFAPFHYWQMGVLSLTVISWIWLSAPTNRCVRYGFLFGLGNFGSGIYWVYISLYRFGGAPLVFAILANVLLVIFLSLFPALVGWLLRKFSAPRSAYRAILIPLFWIGLELARAFFLTGFPWLSVGYSQLFGPLNGLVPIVGVFGTGLVLLIVCALFAQAFSKRTPYPIIIAAFIIIIAFITRDLQFTQAIDKPLSVALVQGNVSQYTKFDSVHMQEDLDHYITSSSRRTEEVIIWPETAIVFMENSVDKDVLQPLNELFHSKHQTLVTGIPSGDLSADYYNSVITLGNGSGRYNKEHLLPFGEYIPLRRIFSIFNKFVDMPLGDFTRGGTYQEPIITNGVPAGVSICFESAFGRVMRQSLPRAQYLINVSNDGWFQGSIAADQHLQMSQMRALELGREMARVTNNGHTVFIDHHGNITARLKPFTQDTLSGRIQPRIGLTPYAKFGNILIYAALLLYVIIASLIYPMRKKNNARTISSQYH